MIDLPDKDNLTKEEIIELLNKLDAVERTELGESLRRMQFTKIQEEILVCILNNEASILVICGGNQSGKSTIGSIICLIFLTGVIPNAIADRIAPNNFLIASGKYLSLALDFTSSFTISQDSVFKLLPEKFIQNFNKEHRILTLKNSSSIMFKSMDSGWEKIQGLTLNGVWVDEEPPNSVIWKESSERVGKKEGWMVLTFSPLKGLSWSYQDLYLKAGKYVSTASIHKDVKEDLGFVHTVEEIDKLKEREVVVQYNTSEDANPRIAFFQMTKYDNSFYPSQSIVAKEIELKDDIIQYQARILGRFGTVTGRAVFNTAKLMQMQSEIRAVPKRFEIKNGLMSSVLKGRLLVYKEKIEGRPYVIGADAAEGRADGDFSCIQILDRMTYEQVAIWHGHISPEELANILYDIGRYYNWAKLAPERNGHGLGVITRLRELKYPNLYYDRDPAAETLTRSDTKTKRFGWQTSRTTKPIMIQNLAALINANRLKINDYNTINELKTYEYDEDGRTNAMGGCYDDRVVSLAIALMVFRRVPATMDKSGEVTRYEDIDNRFGF